MKNERPTQTGELLEGTHAIGVGTQKGISKHLRSEH